MAYLCLVVTKNRDAPNYHDLIQNQSIHLLTTICYNASCACVIVTVTFSAHVNITWWYNMQWNFW